MSHISPDGVGKMSRISEISEKILNGSIHIHFIGIGGSGMFPLVQIVKQKGHTVSGSDNNETETLQAVRKMGCEVFMGQRAENIKGAELIVYTAAIMSDNPELIAAKESGVPLLERAEMLGIVSSWYDNAICICGTHGKTTATSMLTQIFLETDKDISCFIGGKLKALGGGSGRAGSGDTFVCESCEFEDHFLKMYPDTVVILNVDADHLDYFKTLDNIKKSFGKFAEKATKGLIVNGDDGNTLEAIRGIDKPTVTFGLSESNDYFAKDISIRGLETVFEVFKKGVSMGKVTVHVAGEHNVYNALAAIAAADQNGVGFDKICAAMSKFTGAARRFEKIAYARGITVVDDYAHHPAELAAVLTEAKQCGFERVIAVFQPFTYSRTKILFDDFVKCLQIADMVVLTDIMGSREKNDIGIYTRDLAKAIPGCVFFDCPNEIADAQTAKRKEENFDEIIAYLLGELKAGDVVITLGCGDAYKLSKKLGAILEKEEN